MSASVAGGPALRLARALAVELGWQDAAGERVEVRQSPTALATNLPVADMGAAAQALVGLSAAALHERRTGQVQTVTVDRREASLSLTTNSYLTVNGMRPDSWDPLTGYWRAADGWVYLHTAFPHLRDGLLAALGLPAERGAVAAGIARLPAQEIEDRAAAAGVCAIRWRTRDEWQAEPHAVHLTRRPVIRLERIGAGAERPAPTRLARGRGAGDAPLAGIRVLDLSRVIAGPMIGRTLAEHGAEVLRIGAAHLPSIGPLVIDTGFGKRAAFVDLGTAEGRETLAGLVRGADVFIDGYRPGALARHGFGPDDLVRLNPSIVRVTLSAFGCDGPWGGRRGYDTYVQAATGLAVVTPDGPRRLPCQPLDYLTGYLGAAAAMVALRRRMDEGGAWDAGLGLARMAIWLHETADRLGPETAAPAANPSLAEVADLRVEMDSAFGRLGALRPARRLSHTPASLAAPPVPLGSHAPAWLRAR